MQERLLDWYERHQRKLPWRSTRDPYAIVVSEIMLQQTQVDRVIPKYREFLRRFPTFEALARASRAEVIQAWVPLGYNRRAVSLHELARTVTERGCLPREPAELARLKGLGPYTSAAVACFAFGRQVPTIDTNVRRVLGRMFADRVARPDPTPRELDALARDALPPGRAEDWNQALMDLGATICTARAPACGRCPIADLCAGRSDVQPAGAGLRRVAETRADYRPEGPFVGSSRYYRGQIVRRLRVLAPGELLAADELGRRVRSDYGPELQPWLLAMLRALEADGLVHVEPGEELLVRLP